MVSALVFGCRSITWPRWCFGLLRCSQSFRFTIACCSAEIKDQISQMELSAGSVENTLAREENYSSSLLDQNRLNRRPTDLVCVLDQPVSLPLERALSPLALHSPVKLLQHLWQEWALWVDRPFHWCRAKPASLQVKTRCWLCQHSGFA